MSVGYVPPVMAGLRFDVFDSHIRVSIILPQRLVSDGVKPKAEWQTFNIMTFLIFTHSLR